MRSSKIASFAALVGGVAWLVKVALIWANGGENTDGGPVAACYFLGLVVLAVALLAGGYTTVATAPAWLRLVVSVATVLLGWIIFTSIGSAAQGVYTADTWLRDELGIMISALLALLGATIGFARIRATAPAAPPKHGGHRAHRH